jgi:hypothetical protein
MLCEGTGLIPIRLLSVLVETDNCNFLSCVLLTVHIGIIFVNNQLDAQICFMYVYLYSLHVSGIHVPIIRRTVSIRHLVYITLCR